MRATTRNDSQNHREKLAVTTEGLQSLLDCGRPTAVEIGTKAQARIEIGKRVLWNVNKVQRYLDLVATE